MGRACPAWFGSWLMVVQFEYPQEICGIIGVWQTKTEENEKLEHFYSHWDDFVVFAGPNPVAPLFGFPQPDTPLNFE